MKNMTKVVLAFALCLGLTGQAFASWVKHSKQESLEVSDVMGGSYSSTLLMGGQTVPVLQEKDPVRGADLNWDFHRRWLCLSWGLAVRQRTVTTSQKQLNFTGVGGRVGFVTNPFDDPHRWPVGLHTFMTVAVGPMSKLDSGKYNQGILSSYAGFDAGVDVLLHGWKSADGTKYRSAVVASFDVATEGVLANLSTKGVNSAAGQLNSDGGVTKASLSWYW
ncbi:hypothetical protein KGO95_02365 [Patescibacteria group bacterium]|nr:hypothetical protein [Patescibacteria group bacterium]